YQNGRPDDRMEGNVVLTDEVVLAAGGVLPPALPGGRLTSDPGPLDRRREIATTRFEPDVDPLVLPARADLRRQRHTPAQVTRDRAWLQATFEKVDGEAIDVGAPVVHRPRPLEQRRFQLGQVEVEVLGLAPLERRRGVQPRAGIDQILWLEQAPAVLTLVAARPGIVAMRAFAFDVGIGQEPPGDGIVETDRSSLIEQALLEQHHE